MLSNKIIGRQKYLPFINTMKVTTVGNQILEFNITLPSNANTAIAPSSSISVTQRWGVVNGTTQITKFNIVHTTQYTDCSGKQQTVTSTSSTIMSSTITGTTVTQITPTVTKMLDVIVPNNVGYLTQSVLDDLPTSVSLKGNCAYSVFEIQI